MKIEEQSVGRTLVNFNIDSPGSVQFYTAKGVVLEFRGDGECFVRGEKVEENKAIWEAFKAWQASVSNLAPSEKELLEYQLQDARRDLDFCKQAALLQPFRAGDHVRHVGSGETWVLACDQVDNDVLPAGWPETLAKATHCRLVKAATDAERLHMIEQVAAALPDRGGDSSRRQRLGAAQLAAELGRKDPL